MCWLGRCCHTVSSCICLVFYPPWLAAGTGRHYRARWTHSRSFASLTPASALCDLGSSGLAFAVAAHMQKVQKSLLPDAANRCKESEEREELCSAPTAPVLTQVSSNTASSSEDMTITSSCVADLSALAHKCKAFGTYECSAEVQVTPGLAAAG